MVLIWVKATSHWEWAQPTPCCCWGNQICSGSDYGTVGVSSSTEKGERGTVGERTAGKSERAEDQRVQGCGRWTPKNAFQVQRVALSDTTTENT